MSTPGKLLESALWYAEVMKFSIIPVKKDKRPYIQWTPYQTTKATLEQIRKWWEQWPDANIGLVTGKISGIAVIDVDTDEGKQALEPYLPLGFKTPTVTTPKGGHHLYVQPPPGVGMGNNVRGIDGVDYRGENGYVLAPPSVGETGEYRWSGFRIKDVPLAPLPQTYIDRVTQPVHSKEVFTNNEQEMFVNGRRDNDLFHVANAMVKGGSPPQAIQQTLQALCTSWGETDERWIADKISSALKRAEKRERNLSEEVGNWVDATTGNFFTTEIYGGLQLNSKAEKRNVTTILGRLKEKGVIERVGNKNGSFRKVDTECQRIDWMGADVAEYPIALPLGLGELVKILPGNTILISGATNSGKTALLLNIVNLNMERLPVEYFSSEMGKAEFKSRLSHFNCGLGEWKFNAWERTGDFADVIKPDALNIIDFLEIHDKFYKVGGLMKAIHDKLGKGIAVVALQKKSSEGNQTYLHGRGGEMAEEKPRLVLAMDEGVIRVVKGKNWRNPAVSPNGLKKEFKLMEGCKFIELGDGQWEREI